MFILGIESTCDETAAAIVKDGCAILSQVVASQEDLHEQYGGVFPELASRRHAEVIIPVIHEAISKAGLSWQDLTAIAVAHGPGLIGSLLIGINTAKALSLAWELPLVGVNHVEAHLYAARMGQKELPAGKALGVVLSGGHTFLAEIASLGEYQLIGTTIDDAIGEAFDKVAALLGLPYPGGPAVEALAKDGDPGRYTLPKGRVKSSPFDFSFSGLKTAVLYAVKGHQGKKNSPSQLPEEEKKHIAASFQETAFCDIAAKCLLAAQKIDAKAIYLGGGVCQNRRLRALLQEKIPHLPLFWPEPSLCTDNAAMIAGLGYHKYKANPQGNFPYIEPMTRMAPFALV